MRNAQDTSGTEVSVSCRHFGPSAEGSRNFYGGAEMSNRDFGTSAEML